MADAPVSGFRRRWWRRGPWELVATILIGAGVVMLLQPFWLVLYTYSFATTLAGVALFLVVSKFPD
jgi:biotin transporter BioY